MNALPNNNSGLNDALNTLEEKLRKIMPSLTIEQDISIDDKALKPQILEALILVTQEALTNTIKHAEATVFSVSLHDTSDSTLLRISDNGRCEDTFSQGNGLKGISERIKHIGGEVEINNTSREGFSIIAKIPKLKATRATKATKGENT